MDSITGMFKMFAWILGGLAFLGIVAIIIYFKWVSSGQERGI